MSDRPTLQQTPMDRIIVTTVSIAACLPTGINDPKALTKYHDEQQELRDKLAQGDTLGAVLEVADVAYYAVKCMLVGFLSYNQAWDGITDACVAGGVLPDLLAEIMLAKYEDRMQGLGKKDEPERERVRALLETKGIVIVGMEQA